MMRILWLSWVLLFGFHGEENKFVIREKEITVSGNTSLGKFNCTYQVEGIKDTLSFVDNQSNDDFLFDIPVADFGCGNFLLNNDFRKTIKARDFPNARVAVTNLRRHHSTYFCNLQLELAGKTLYFRNFQLDKGEGKLSGHLRLKFDTLGLEPPRKLGGLVKVDEALFISLSLFL